MNKKSLRLHSNRDKEEESVESYREMCYKCCRPSKACFCQYIQPFSTNFHFCFLMHPKEAKLAHVGTGRMSHVALKNSRIIVGENFDECRGVQSLLSDPKYFPMVLYPGDEAINLSQEKLDRSLFSGKTPLVFIIDGTWPCAKSMMRDSKILHGLPRLSFDSKSTSRYLIRHQPASFCLSTIESLYLLLSLLEKQELESIGEPKETMLEALDQLVAFQKKCALDPDLNHYRRNPNGFKKASERVQAKRWEHRKICYEDKNY